MCLQFAWQAPISENDRHVVQNELGVKARPGYEIPLQVLENARAEQTKMEIKRQEMEMVKKIMDSAWEKANQKAKKKAAEHCQVDPYMDNTGNGQEERNKAALGSSSGKKVQDFKAPLETDKDADKTTALKVPEVPLETSDKKIDMMIDVEVAQETHSKTDTKKAAEVPEVPLETSDKKIDMMIDVEVAQETHSKTDTKKAAEVPEVPKTEEPENQEMEKDAADMKAPCKESNKKRKAANKPEGPKKIKKKPDPKEPSQPKKRAQPKKKTWQKKTEKGDKDKELPKKPEKIDEDAIARKIHSVPQLLKWSLTGLHCFLCLKSYFGSLVPFLRVLM